MALLLTQTSRLGPITFSRPQSPRYPATLGWTNAGIPVAPTQAPFAQYDWPVPRGFAPRGFDWVRSTPIQLIGQDQFFMAGAINFSPPGLYVRQQLPPGFSSPGIQVAAAQSPFFQTDWPSPQRPRPGKDWTWSTPINLIGQDTIYGAPGQVPSYDLSPPKLRPYATALNGWLQSGIQVAVVQSPFFQTDWPSPQRPRPGKDWMWSTPINLIGLDTVYGAPGQVPTYNTNPPPKGPQYSVSLLGWTNPGSTSGGITIINQPGSIYFSSPSLYVKLQPATFGWINPGIVPPPVVQGPFFQTDWPVPQSPRQPVRFGWIDYDVFPPQVNPFFQTDFPQPVTVRFLTSRLGWINPGITTPPVQSPFFQADWPQPPRGRVPGKDWVWSTPVNLIGKDTVYGAPGQVPTYDLSPPKLRTVATTLNGWLNPGITVTVTQNPFFQTDWPLPQAPRQPVRFGWIDYDVFQPQTFPFFQTDFPQPVVARFPTSRLGWINPGIQVAPAQSPFFQTDWPQAPRGRVPGKDWIWPTPINLIGQDRVYGAPGQVPTYAFPLPQRPLPRSDWVWPTPVNLIGKDKVYGAPGQVPTYDMQQPPRGPLYPISLRGFVNFTVPPSLIPAGFTQSGNRPLLTIPIYPVFWKGRSGTGGQFILDQSSLDGPDTLG